MDIEHKPPGEKMSAASELIVPEARVVRERPVSELPMPAPTSETSAMMVMIERASKDPAVDLEKMRQLFALRKEIIAEQKANIEEENRQKFDAAMNAAQAEMTPIAADATNEQTRSNYASYAQLDRAIRPIYTKHGFAISFSEGDSPKPDHVRVLGYLSHTGGYSRTYHTDMPADGKGAKGGDVMTKTHAAGAAKSYGKRYILRDVFNIAVGEEDKDGNTDEPETIGPGQLKEIERLITEVGADKAKFMAYIKVQSLDKILVASYDAVIAALKAKRKPKNG